MAGDWIKMRTDLYRDPKVCVIADLLYDNESDLARYVNQHCQRDMTVTRNVTRNVTVGALVSVWGVLRHRGKRENDDLVVLGCSILTIDDISDVPGFGSAMESVGWVRETEEGIVLPNFFEEFNIDPRKDQTESNAERQRRFREKRNALRNVTVTLQSNTEKRREEKSISIGDEGRSAFIERIYQAYPRKVGKPAALKAIAKALEAIDGDSLLALVESYAAARKGEDQQFTPHPSTWFNEQRWADDPGTWKRSDANGVSGKHHQHNARPSAEQQRQDANLAAIAEFASRHAVRPRSLFPGDAGSDGAEADRRLDG